jgi:hypothetical protein
MRREKCSPVVAGISLSATTIAFVLIQAGTNVGALHLQIFSPLGVLGRGDRQLTWSLYR